MKCFKKEQTIINVLVFFVVIASALEKVGLFLPFPSLPFVARNDRKQYKRQNIVLHNKPRPLFLEFS